MFSAAPKLQDDRTLSIAALRLVHNHVTDYLDHSDCATVSHRGRDGLTVKHICKPSTMHNFMQQDGWITS